MGTPTSTPTTYSAAALAKAVGLRVPTIHHYLQQGLLPHPPRRGPATAYTEEHLLRLRAVRKMRMRGLTLARIKAKLTAMSLDQVRAMVEPPPPPAPVAPSASVDPAAERWERATLVPGLELMVRADAGPLVLRLAREIMATYRAG
ncbi:MAG: helix-turn-helix domain-containing protein [Polyangiales bacterium]